MTDPFGIEETPQIDVKAYGERASQSVYDSIQNATKQTARSRQAQRRVIGVSNLGHCRQALKYMLLDQEDTDERDMTPAFIGTVLGDAIEAQIKKDHPEWIIQETLEFPLPSGGFVKGHSDIIIPASAAITVEEYEAGEPGFIQGVWDLKGLALDTPIITPNGWTTMGDLKVGDQVFDMDGKPTTVTAKSEVKNIPCYEVTIDRKHKITCDENHLWWLEGITGNRYVRNVKDIAGKTGSSRIPLAGALQYPEKDLPIDPYVLGYFMGNGSRGTGQITTHGEDFASVSERFSIAGYEPGIDYLRNDGSRNASQFSAKGLVGDLRDAGVLDSKILPVEYLQGSVEQRKDLLAGLMDSDGTWNIKRRRASFCTTDDHLAGQFCDLVASLGQRVQTSMHEVSGYGKTVMAFYLEWTPSFNPFRSSRKASKFEDRSGESRVRRWHEARVKEVPSVPTQCIQVDSPTESFLCGDMMIPTHNSKAELETIRKYGQSLQQKFQVHAYARAAIEKGHLDPSQPILVGDVYYDRSGRDVVPYGIFEVYDESVIHEIDEWVSDVTYAVLHDEDAPKDKPVEWCMNWCPFFTVCRGAETTPQGLLTDETVTQAVGLYAEGAQMEREGKKLKNLAKENLEGVQGSTGEYTIKHVYVGPTEIPGYTRSGYHKTEVRKVPKSKKKGPTK